MSGRRREVARRRRAIRWGSLVGGACNALGCGTMCSRLRLAGRASALVAFALALAAVLRRVSTARQARRRVRRRSGPCLHPSDATASSHTARGARDLGGARARRGRHGQRSLARASRRDRPRAPQQSRDARVVGARAIRGRVIWLRARCAPSHRRARRQRDALGGRSVQHLRRNERRDRFGRRRHVGAYADLADLLAVVPPPRPRRTLGDDRGGAAARHRRRPHPQRDRARRRAPGGEHAVHLPGDARACETRRSCRCRRRRTTSPPPPSAAGSASPRSRTCSRRGPQLAQARLQLATDEGNLLARAASSRSRWDCPRTRGSRSRRSRRATRWPTCSPPSTR